MSTAGAPIWTGRPQIGSDGRVVRGTVFAMALNGQRHRDCDMEKRRSFWARLGSTLWACQSRAGQDVARPKCLRPRFWRSSLPRQCQTCADDDKLHDGLKRTVACRLNDEIGKKPESHHRCQPSKLRHRHTNRTPRRPLRGVLLCMED